MAARVPIPVVVALLFNRHRVFMMRRPRDVPLPGAWEFPGGKVEYGESPEEALGRELHEELGLRPSRLLLFTATSHVYDLPGGPVQYVLIAYRANVRNGRWSRAGRWMDARKLAAVDIVEGSRPIVWDLLEASLVR